LRATNYYDKIEIMAKQDKTVIRTARAKLIIIPNDSLDREIVFRGFGKDEHEASDQAQRASYIAGWRHESCSGWIAVTKMWYGRATTSGPYCLWGNKKTRPPYETAYAEA